VEYHKAPFLFDLYLDDCLRAISEKYNVNEDNILAYADDIAIICSSLDKLKEIASSIESLFMKFGLILNKEKSGCLEVRKPRSHILLRDENISGFPVVEMYKYLGVEISQTLSCVPYVKRLRQTINALRVNLFPFLAHASAQDSLFLWQLMVRPLFDYGGLFFRNDRVKSHQDYLYRTIRNSIRTFIGLNKSTKKDAVEPLIKHDFEKWNNHLWTSSEKAWRDWKNYETPTKIRWKEDVFKQVEIPREWISYTNLLTKPCPRCIKGKTPMSANHLKYFHNIIVPSARDLLEKFILISKEKVKRNKEETKNVISQLGKIYLEYLSTII